MKDFRILFSKVGWFSLPRIGMRDTVDCILLTDFAEISHVNQKFGRYTHHACDFYLGKKGVPQKKDVEKEEDERENERKNNSQPKK